MRGGKLSRLKEMSRIVKFEPDEEFFGVTPYHLKQQRNDEKVAGWTEKPLNGQFLRQSEVVTSNLSWTWLKKGEFKK